MVYIFEDGRILCDSKLVTTNDAGKYLELETVPEIEKKEGKIGVITGCHLETGEIVIQYIDIPMPEPSPTFPTLEPTEQDFLQAEILLNQVTILENQHAQDAVMAEILLGQLEV